MEFNIPIPELFWLHLTMSVVSGAVVFGLIQKFKELDKVNTKLHIWLLNAVFSFLAYPFAMFYYSVSNLEAIWVVLYTFIGAPVIYDILKKQNLVNYTPKTLKDTTKNDFKVPTSDKTTSQVQIVEETKKPLKKPKKRLNGDNIIDPIKAKHYITSPFGKRKDPITEKVSKHYGTDYGTNNKKVNAVAITDGVVKGMKSKADGNGAGNRLYLQHNINGKDYFVGYFHLDSFADLKVGDKVKQGQKIGVVGNTGTVAPKPTKESPLNGTHLHYQFMRGNKYSKTNAIDFEKWKKEEV